MIQAVIFDMDGVLIDSEETWGEAREQIATEAGGRWFDGAQEAMMGMSSGEWSQWMHDELEVPMSAEEISGETVKRLTAIYEERLPLIDGAVDAVKRIAAEWPCAVASSSNRPLIDLVLDRAGLAACFEATVSSEEVPKGKPEPDVYLEAAKRLGQAPESCAAIEDSSNGLRSAAAAGMRVIAVPNAAFPPADDALALAAASVEGIAALGPEVIRSG